ncbi:MAG: heavy-metal-associated domain-containing protein [Chloroflexi bacterium]|nr:heavy-metal-associated domain-containing protein [Chloroflexota bacterium]
MASVEAKLRQVSGIRKMNVDLASQTATVVFDPTRTDVEMLREAVKKSGYAPKSEEVTAA